MSIQTDAVEQAAQHLVAARRAGVAGERIAEAARPGNYEAALAIQERVTALLGLAIDGWKCSLPPSDDRVVVAPIYAGDITTDRPVVWPTGNTARIEPEVAFVINKDLLPRATPYTEDEIVDAIGEVRLVLELLGCRYADRDACSFPEMLADRLQNEGVLVGPVLEKAFDYDLTAFPITITGPNGVVSQHEGKHPNEHPLHPYIWLASFLNTRGTGLRKGQVVITGSYAGAVDVPVDTPLDIQFGSLGHIKTTVRTTASR